MNIVKNLVSSAFRNQKTNEAEELAIRNQTFQALEVQLRKEAEEFQPDIPPFTHASVMAIVRSEASKKEARLVSVDLLRWAFGGAVVCAILAFSLLIPSGTQESQIETTVLTVQEPTLGSMLVSMPMNEERLYSLISEEVDALVVAPYKQQLVSLETDFRDALAFTWNMVPKRPMEE